MPTESSVRIGVLSSRFRENAMSDKKIIAVVGATAAQGGGLVRAILNDPSGEFAARAMTRDVSSQKTKARATLGAEVVDGMLISTRMFSRAGCHAAPR